MVARLQVQVQGLVPIHSPVSAVASLEAEGRLLPLRRLVSQATKVVSHRRTL